MAKKGKSQKTIVLVKLFRLLCEDERYWNTWRTAEHWIELIRATFPSAAGPFDFKKGDLNNTIRRDAQLKHCDIVLVRSRTAMVFTD